MTIPSDLPPEQVDPTYTINQAVRRAVYLVTCEEQGHDYDLGNLLRTGDTPNPNKQDSFPNTEVEAVDSDNKLPHLVCRRCGLVWILIDEPGFGYDDALSRVRKRMGSPADRKALKPRPKQERIVELRKQLRQEMRSNGKSVPVEVAVFENGSARGAMTIKTVNKIPSFLQP